MKSSLVYIFVNAQFKFMGRFKGVYENRVGSWNAKLCLFQSFQQLTVIGGVIVQTCAVSGA